MANELNNAEQTTGITTKQNSDSNATSLKELQDRIKTLESENGKLRDSVTNASADASNWKKQFKEKDDALKAMMSDEERAKQEQDEANAALQKELETLRAERNIAKISGALVANDIGMDAETANAVAEAMNAGDTEKVLNGIRQFITAHDKSLREDALRNNQTLQGGASTKSVTREEFKNMGYKEMLQFKMEHPEQYAEFTKR